MTAVCDLTINFAATGNSLAFLGGGWARSEDDFTWGIGAESHLMFPRLSPIGEYVLTLDVVPFVHPSALPSQRLIVSVNDTVLGSSEIDRPTLLGYRIPPNLPATDRLVVTLQHPDAARPCEFTDSADDRLLAFAVSEAKLFKIVEPPACDRTRLPIGLMLASNSERGRGAQGANAKGRNAVGADAAGSDAGHVDLIEWATARSGLTIPQIALKFELLGENCEFGLFQRRCEAEPLGLLRFSSTFMRNLIRGIDTGFADLGQVDDIDPRLEGAPRKEFMIHEKKYGLVYHTFVYEGERSVWLMREQEAARLKFLRRKFIEELESTDKIFVYKFSAGVSDAEILPLHMALNRHSRGNAALGGPGRTRPPGRHDRGHHARAAEGLYRSLRT